MKKYYNPEMIIEVIEVEDILTLSNTEGLSNIAVLEFGDFE